MRIILQNILIQYYCSTICRNSHVFLNRGNDPPAGLKRQFASAGLPDSSRECERLSAQLQGEAELLDDVDEGAVAEYKGLVRSIKDLEEQSEASERRVKEGRRQIQDIKQTWLEKLQQLVDAISRRFGHYFQTMGFAGDVQLNCGRHEVHSTRQKSGI